MSINATDCLELLPIGCTLGDWEKANGYNRETRTYSDRTEPERPALRNNLYTK